MANDNDPDEISTEPMGTGSEDELKPPVVRDHTMIKLIGRGGYGDVWLARSIVGTYRAVKVVYRASFDKSRPFDREFEGIQNFEPKSRSHDGLVDLLQVGRNEEEDYFYYVMELGDDVETVQDIDPEKYIPKTLETEKKKRGRLPVDECLNIGLDVTDALKHLHENGLIHRDIKPSNIIFVNGVPKIADIGLVVSVDATMSEVGTPGYIPLEGPGTVQADIFGLGKVLYELSTGRDRTEYPELPLDLDDLEDPDDFFEFNRIVNKACHNRAAERFRSAEDFHQMLTYRLSGGSIKRVEQLERLVSVLKKVGIVAAIALAIGGYAYFNIYRTEQITRRNLVQSMVRQGNQLIDSGDYLRAFPVFVEALRLDFGDEKRERIHRLRIRALLKELPILEQMHFVSPIADSSLSPDGRFVATANNSGEISLVDLIEKTNAVPWLEVSNKLECIGFIQDGRFVITGGDEGVQIFELETGDSVTHSFHPLQVVYAFDISDDGRLIAFAHYDPNATNSEDTKGLAYVTLWDARSQTLIREITRDTKPFLSVDFGPENGLVSVCGRNGYAQVFRVSDSSPIGERIQHGTWVYSAEFSPDGKTLFSTDFSGTIRVSDAQTGESVEPPVRVVGALRTVSFNTVGDLFATAGWNYSVNTWDRGGLRNRLRITHPRKHMMMASFSTVGEKLVTGTVGGEIRYWNLRSLNEIPPHNQSFLSSDGSTWIVLENGRIQIVRDGEETSWIAVPDKREVLSVSVSDDGRTLATILKHKGASGRVGDLFIAKLVGTEFTLEHIPTSSSGYEVLLNSDGSNGATWGGRSINCFDVQSASISWTTDYANEITTVAFSPDDKIVAICSGEDVDLRNLGAGELIYTLSHPGQIANHANFSPDGKLIATGTGDTTLLPGYAQTWSVASGEIIGKKMVHEDGVKHVEFSPDGNRLATASEDNTACVWDTFTNEMVFPPLRHQQQVTEARFSSDGLLIATACQDQTARVWDSNTGEALTPPLWLPWQFNHVQFGGEGVQVVARRSLQNGGQTVVWQLEEDKNSLELLTLYSKVLSGHRRELNGGIIPESTEELKIAWEAYNANNLENFQIR